MLCVDQEDQLVYLCMVYLQLFPIIHAIKWTGLESMITRETPVQMSCVECRYSHLSNRVAKIKSA